MSDEFKIEKDIPLPDRIGSGRARKYPFSRMEVGDSFFAPVAGNRIHSAVSQFSKRTGMKFTVKKVDGGCRVWRLS